MLTRSKWVVPCCCCCEDAVPLCVALCALDKGVVEGVGILVTTGGLMVLALACVVVVSVLRPRLLEIQLMAPSVSDEEVVLSDK